MVRWSSHLGSLGRLTRAVFAAGALLTLLGGVVLGAFHHHTGTGTDAHCVVCALAGTHATSPPQAPVPAPPQLLHARATTLGFARPARVELRHSTARAPPLA